MVGMRASRPGSLCAQQSCEPGSGGAIRPRGPSPFLNELPGLLAFSCALCAKGTLMVALAVPTFGATIPLSLHRTMLHAAHDAFDSGDYVRCGCQLREAIDRYVTALCKLHGVKFSERKQLEKRPPAVKLGRLIKAGIVDPGVGGWLGEVIDTCNQLAHCQPVRRGSISLAIEITYSILDETPLSRGGVEGGAV